MSGPEESYLSKFRALSIKKKEIAGMIAGLEGICGSLKNWEKTAADISSPACETTHPEWSEERLKGILVLRSLLIEYSRQIDGIRKAWDGLTVDQRIGLANPSTI